MSTPKVYTANEARRVLRIGRSRFYDLLRQGKIDSIRNGRRFLIPEECLAIYLQREVAAQDERRSSDD